MDGDDARHWRATPALDDSMNDGNERPEPDDSAPLPNLPGIIATLGELGPGAVITLEGIAHLFNRHPGSVKRAVRRGELPPPCRMFDQDTWTAGVIVKHIEHRLAEAEQKVAEQAKKMLQLSR